jgi:hypothetical protein
MPSFWEIALSDEHDNSARVKARSEPRGSTIPRWVPRADMRFEPVQDRYGWRLALVFGNHAPGGICPYYVGDLCHHCDIGAGEGATFDHATNRQRMAWFADFYRSRLESVSHLVLYNSGSVLNPREMPPDLLDELLAIARSLPAARVVSLDSRESYIRPEILRRILAAGGERLTLRPILGIESFDDRIRNDILRKAMPRTGITRVFRELGSLAAEYAEDRIGLDVNIVIGAPGTNPETAVSDAAQTALFALQTGAENGVNVDLNLHPYYIGARGLARFPGHGRCSIKTTAEAAAQIAQLVRSMRARSSVFIGWQDEGHDCEQNERSLELARARAAFDRFNQTNEPGVLTESWLT